MIYVRDLPSWGMIGVREDKIPAPKWGTMFPPKWIKTGI